MHRRWGRLRVLKGYVLGIADIKAPKAGAASLRTLAVDLNAQGISMAWGQGV